MEDAQGSVIAIDRSNEQITEFKYDEHGNRVKTTFGVGTPVESYILIRYDDQGRQTAEMQQAAASVDAEWSESEQSFIVAGSSPAEHIPTKLYEYDSQGRLSAVELPAVPNPDNNDIPERPRYEYGYDAQGNHTLIRDPLDRETWFTFDAQGRQKSRTLPLGFGPGGVYEPGQGETLPGADFKETFAYDDRGREISHVSFEGVTTTTTYDASTGRVSQKQFTDGVNSETWSYLDDAFGREHKVIQNDGVNTRTVETHYDAEGRVAEVSSPEGTIKYEYDNLGRKIQMSVHTDATSPAERVTTYGYDPLGRLATVTEDYDPAETTDTPLDTSYRYDLVGNLSRTDLPNDVIATNEYDELFRLDTLNTSTKETTRSVD